METLSPLTQRFILHFGEMGSRWGINRTVGQMYAFADSTTKCNKDKNGRKARCGSIRVF
ncbi:hypothetical protein BH11PSE12_BH11PSE12_27230 [soil metagenome]